jgi:hypothetical protein
MQQLIHFLAGFLLGLGIVLAVDLITIYLRRRARRATVTTEPASTERRENEPTG